jgi:hypothetical protein
MRQVVSLALMTAILLGTCSCAVTDGGKAQERALEQRTALIAAESIELTANITADYGDRVYEYAFQCTETGDLCRLQVLEPETIAGLTAEISDDGGEIVFDGARLSVGALDGDGLEPVSAVPLMIKTWRTGYIEGAVFEKLNDTDTLKITYRVSDDETLETWFDRDTGKPIYADILADGRRVIACSFTEN